MNVHFDNIDYIMDSRGQTHTSFTIVFSDDKAVHRLSRRPSEALSVNPEAGIIPGLELFSEEERRSLLTKAENLWKALQANDLGGFSGQNRPFYVLNHFKEVIEDFGRRNTGYRHSQNEIEAHRAALANEAKP